MLLWQRRAGKDVLFLWETKDRLAAVTSTVLRNNRPLSSMLRSVRLSVHRFTTRSPPSHETAYTRFPVDIFHKRFINHPRQNTAHCKEIVCWWFCSRSVVDKRNITNITLDTGTTYKVSVPCLSSIMDSMHVFQICFISNILHIFCSCVRRVVSSPRTKIQSSASLNIETQ